MLAVLAIIGILIALLAPAISTIVRGPLLTQSSDLIVSVLNLGQQTATSRNQSVEVRFYQYADPAVQGESVNNASSGKYRALQLFLVNADGTVMPFNSVQTLPTGIIADAGTGTAATLSSLLASTQAKVWNTNDPKTSLPRAGTVYNCCVFQFRSDGSTNLPPIPPTPLPPNWFITLHNIIDGDSRTTPPVNFATIQLDPINGASTVYRP